VQGPKNLFGKSLNLIGNKCPGPLAYHTTTIIDNKAYLIGGSKLGVDSIKDYILDLTSLEWTALSRNDPNAPKSIDEHTATLVGDQIYIFGGNISGFKNNQIFVFDTQTNKWHIPKQSTGPCARSNHSTVLYQDKLYIFGGKDQDTFKLNDMWAYDLKTSTWTEVKDSIDKPLTRSGHSSSVYKNFMIVFGGIHELTKELNDLQAYDFNNNQWFSIFEENSSPTHSNNQTGLTSGRKNIGKIEANSPYGKSPTMTRPTYTRGETHRNDFSISIQKTNSRNKARQVHTSLGISNSLSLAQIERKIRQKRKDQEQVHEETLLTSPTSLSMKNSFLIKTAGKAFDNYAQYFKSKAKKQSFTSHEVGSPPHERVKGKIEGNMPKPRDGHTGVICDDRYLVIFGGDRHHMPFNDLFTLDLAKEI
jgi:hypothetical protein